MKKSLPRKKVVQVATTRKKKAASRKKPVAEISCISSSAEKTIKKSSKKVSPNDTKKRSASPKSQKRSTASAKNKVDTLPLEHEHSFQEQLSPTKTNPPMISLKSYTDQESLIHFEEERIPKRKKAASKKSRRSKTVRNRSAYDPDEVDFELEDHEFLDEELVSWDEFDSILNKTQKKIFNVRNIDEDDNEIGRITEHRKDAAHSTRPGNRIPRKKVPRRRQIDPTTCERDYTVDEVEFMTALDEYKRNSGRMFPTCSEILEVLLGLGYAKAPLEAEEISPPVPAVQKQAAISVTESISVCPGLDEVQTLTLTVDNFTTEIPPTLFAIGFEYNVECSSFFLNDSFAVELGF